MSETPEPAARRDAAPDTARVDLRGAQTGDVTIGDVAGGDIIKSVVNVDVNNGTIVNGPDPREDERRRLRLYLEGLAAKLAALPLRGLDEGLSRGRGLELAHVYVALATETRVEVTRGAPRDLRAFFEDDAPRRPLRREHDPDVAAPGAALYRGVEERAGEIALERALPVAEALRRHRRLALLGEPGGGKSTFLRYLAWTLARRELDPHHAPALAGWDDAPALIPILLPLRALAARLARGGGDMAIVAAATDELHACGARNADDALSAALARGAVLLLFDGLDEVPSARTPAAADRLSVLLAVRSFAERYAACPAVLTSRPRAFDDELREHLAWPVESLAPFAEGQIRQFVSAWYGELAAGGRIDAGEAQRLGAALVGAILDPTRPRLRAMARTPLLLTLMALVLREWGDLPRDRPRLYERILELLLGQWDQAREGQSLAQALDRPGWEGDSVRRLLDRLAYQAHASASSDGYGRIPRGELYVALTDFFRQSGVSRWGDALQRFLDYVEQRSGLLLPDGADAYVFAHLSLQEHCAGREIVLDSEHPVALMLEHRHDDRWREPIMLGAGLMQPVSLNQLLGDLIERDEDDALKPAERWYRDLILAAEIGADRGWDLLKTQPGIKVTRWRSQLATGLVALLGDRDQPLPIAERVRAGFLLGDLGDTRFPTTVEQWRHELGRAGSAGAYFCALPQPAGETPLWIARYPITNAQLQTWLRAEGLPPWPLAADPHFNRPNQPAAGVSWVLASAFCAWLSGQLGASVRLPSEAEWLAAAYGDDGRRYPWGDERGSDRAAHKDDHMRRAWPYTAPVGCYPLGASPVGALDMAGNVWEWTSTLWAGDGAAGEQARVLRGGGYRSKKADMRPGGRIRLAPELGSNHGFRVLWAAGGGAQGG